METNAWKNSRTVVVSGVPDVLPISRMIDKLMIHFQSRRRSNGGDVQVVKYPTNMDRVAFVTFEEAAGNKKHHYNVDMGRDHSRTVQYFLADAERVVQKEQQIMADDEFPGDYLLTVFPFTRDVFLYVPSATVDLSLFGRDQASLIQSLRSAHRSLRFQPLLQQRKATIEGPFTAVQALREDLIRRASRIKSTVSAQTAAVKLRETPLNPRVISHHEFVSSVSCSGSKAKPEPASSNSLSTPLQSTGEATKVQTLSNAKTQNASSRQNVTSGGLAVGSFCNTDSDEEEHRTRLQMSTEYRTERAKASSRQVLGEEINAGIRSSLSGLDLLAAEEVSAKQQREDGFSQKHTRPDRISAAKIRGENRLGLSYSSTNYLKESDQSSSAITAKLLQTGLKDVSQSSENDTEDREELSAVCPKHPEDTCIWVDSYTFRYIEKFDKEFDRCLRGLDASIECAEGTDLMRIVLKQCSRTDSRIQLALENLSILVEFWMLTLRVHQIDYNEEDQPDKQTVIQICSDENILFDDVLYLVEDSCIKVIGPSISGHLFCRGVEDRIAQLKDQSHRI